MRLFKRAAKASLRGGPAFLPISFGTRHWPAVVSSAAWTARSARTALPHPGELCSLLSRKNLLQTGVDIFLKRRDLLPLTFGQPQVILETRRKHLAGTGHSSGSTWPSGTTRSASGSTRSRSSCSHLAVPHVARTAALAAARSAGHRPGTATASESGRFAGVQLLELIGRDASILVGIGPIQKGMQADVGDFIPRQSAVLVGIERHQPGDELLGGRRRAAVEAPSGSAAASLWTGRLRRCRVGDCQQEGGSEEEPHGIYLRSRPSETGREFAVEEDPPA